jgi:hypothetical protein
MDTSALLQVARETVGKVTLCFVVTSNPAGAPNARIVRHGVQPKPTGLCSVVLERSGEGWLQQLTSPRDAALYLPNDRS